MAMFQPVELSGFHAESRRCVQGRAGLRAVEGIFPTRRRIPGADGMTFHRLPPARKFRPRYEAKMVAVAF
jgi:hypothetical protein